MGECRLKGGQMIARLRPRRRDDDGAAAVELALVLPILLLLVFGIISFGIIFAQQLAVNNGVRQGVRTAVVAGNTTQQTCGQVLTSIQAASGPTIGMSTSDVKVQVQRVSSTTGAVQFTCFTGGATKTPTGGDINTRVCESNTTENSIKAVAEYDTRLLTGLPFMTSPTFTLKATAVYRCEFS
jgi:Flp pilus assembly protein TadG